MRFRAAGAGALVWLGIEALVPAHRLPVGAVRELQNVLALGEGGRPVYWCPCRVD
jgi:hypothetical protein